MAFCEQLLYGHDHTDENGARQELARSAGMGGEAAAEVAAKCEAWGQAPALGLQHPVMISLPLESAMPAIRGRLWAVVRIAPGERPLFHAVVLADSTYAGFGRNPYALATVAEYQDEWNGHRGMDRLEIEAEHQPVFLDRAPAEGDVGLVDEAVLEYLLQKKLHLPLEQGLSDADRALALVIASLPESARKTLRFASFTTAKGHSYDITSLETEGAAFAGWRRLMMARLDTGVTDQQAAYKTELARHLASGDLNAIARLSTRHDFRAPVASDALVATRNVVPQSAPPAARPPVKRAAPVPAPTRSAAPTAAAGPGARPSPVRPAATRSAMVPDHGLDPAAQPSRPRQRSSYRPKVRTGATVMRNGAGKRLLRMVVVLLLIFGAGWVGTMWLEGRTLSESLEWAGIPGMDGWTRGEQRDATLLEVVDVGRVYKEALKRTGGSGLGLAPSGDKAREMALGKLQAKAVTPLLEQAGMYVDLANEGIRSGARPDREEERLRTLAGQGAALTDEWDRLELAWYSFTTGTNWQDLSKLSDAAVVARRDSLERAERGALADVRSAMGAGDERRKLGQARRQMAAMADVVDLIRADRWSAGWEKRLEAAAEQVSPSAGKTTRAYRNAAFALLRLKRAERETGPVTAFSGLYDAANWPPRPVADVLPALHREVGRFADRTAPPLLAGTVGLYAALADPEETIDRITDSSVAWDNLQQNAAVQFDPEIYLDLLDRLRFEAALRRTRPHGDLERVPAHLWPAAGRPDLVAFADSLESLSRAGQWRALAVRTPDTFLRRWAEHLASDADARLARLRQGFGLAWQDCCAQAAALQADVKAGYDWSGKWRRLYAAASQARTDYGAALAADPSQSGRLAGLDELLAALDRERPLLVNRVTVRLQRDVLEAGTEVRLELAEARTGRTWRSEPFRVGPAAPANSGWVGTSFLEWTVPYGSRDLLTGRVVRVDDGRPLLDVSYGSLAQEGGPALLARPRDGATGSIAFKLDLEAYWGGLSLPDLGPVF